MSLSLYSVPPATQAHLTRLRFNSARTTQMQAVVYAIDPQLHEIHPESDTILALADLAEELPDNSARFVVLSYPKTAADGRMTYPFLLVYWRPPTAGQQNKMLYAGAVELMRDKAGVARYVARF